MKCPHCDYRHGDDADDNYAFHEGVEGGFYSLPINIDRKEDVWPYRDEKRVYGCPECGKLFIDI